MKLEKHLAFSSPDGEALQYLKDSKVLWQGKANGKIIDIAFDAERNAFWLLGKNSVSFFSVKDLTITEAFSGDNFNCFALANGGKEIIVGTNDGYQIIDVDSRKPREILSISCLTEITTVEEIDETLVWYDRGAFTTDKDGALFITSKRWLPSDSVVDIENGPDHSLLILTDKGLAICFKAMTLHDKAMY